MSKQTSCADELVSGLMEDEQLDPEDLNPFSFREFLRWKNQDHQDQDHQDQVVQLQSAAEEEDEGGQEVRVTFDPKEEGWGRSLQAGVRGTEEEQTRPEDHQGGEEGGGGGGGGAAAAAAGGGGGGGENEEGREENFSCRRIQIHQDNVSLRKSIKELQSRSDANELRVQQLSGELVQRRSQDHKENQDLESLVQCVEQNLRLMTKRALKAEGSVSKLKVALQQLQLENDRLKAADSEIVMTMRHNAQVASEYLNKTASHAHSSISQLLGEAETLCLVSQLLKSIDKISNLDPES